MHAALAAFRPGNGVAKLLRACTSIVDTPDRVHQIGPPCELESVHEHTALGKKVSNNCCPGPSGPKAAAFDCEHAVELHGAVVNNSPPAALA